jgi:hypothetical protein
VECPPLRTHVADCRLSNHCGFLPQCFFVRLVVQHALPCGDLVERPPFRFHSDIGIAREHGARDAPAGLRDHLVARIVPATAVATTPSRGRPPGERLDRAARRTRGSASCAPGGAHFGEATSRPFESYPGRRPSRKSSRSLLAETASAFQTGVHGAHERPS